MHIQNPVKPSEMESFAKTVKGKSRKPFIISYVS